MIEISLTGLRFYKTHGLHAGEALVAGGFEVNLSAFYLPQKIPVTSITQTIDYTQIFALVKERMAQRTELLETLATEIAQSILEQFEKIEQVNISITKLNPPIANFIGSVGVSYQIKRNNS